MKKTILLIFFIISVNLWSQEYEIIRNYKFGNPIEYKEIWNPIEEGHPGIYELIVWNKDFLILNGSKCSWHLADDLSQELKFDSVHFPNMVYFTNQILVLGELESAQKINIYMKSKDLKKPDYILDLKKDKITGEGGKYYTENKLFISGVYWELLPDGQTVFHDEKQMKNEMDNGLREYLGIVSDDNGIYYGDNCITSIRPPDYKSYFNDIIIPSKYDYLNGKIGTCIGTDKHGLSYFYKFTNSANEKRPTRNPALPIQILISVLDPWTHVVTVLELPENFYNPPRNKNGLIANCAQCIDEEGNIYFTDCNKEEGCYEIKKVSTDWIKQYDFYNREIGRMNANHIPLQKEAKSMAENNGYNFDNEYLWILEYGREWCKVRKVDAREGWIETKYIDFN